MSPFHVLPTIVIVPLLQFLPLPYIHADEITTSLLQPIQPIAASLGLYCNVVALGYLPVHSVVTKTNYHLG